MEIYYTYKKMHNTTLNTVTRKLYIIPMTSLNASGTSSPQRA